MSKSEENQPVKTGRPKGYEKSGGRQKGTPNRNSKRLAAALDEADFSVADEFLRLYESLNDADKLAEIKFLFRYVYPQLKETELPAEAVATNPAIETPTSELLSILK